MNNQKIVKYKLKNKIIYIEKKNDSIIHFVANTHFNIYIEKRKCIPNICKIFDKVKERNLFLEELKIVI